MASNPSAQWDCKAYCSKLAAAKKTRYPFNKCLRYSINLGISWPFRSLDGRTFTKKKIVMDGGCEWCWLLQGDKRWQARYEEKQIYERNRDTTEPQGDTTASTRLRVSLPWSWDPQGIPKEGRLCPRGVHDEMLLQSLAAHNTGGPILRVSHPRKAANIYCILFLERNVVLKRAG